MFYICVCTHVVITIFIPEKRGRGMGDDDTDIKRKARRIRFVATRGWGGSRRQVVGVA